MISAAHRKGRSLRWPVINAPMSDRSSRTRIRVLFVCMGNICRSPLAEGVFCTRSISAVWRTVSTVESAGTGGWHAGELPDPQIRAIAKRRGIELCGPRDR